LRNPKLNIDDQKICLDKKEGSHTFVYMVTGTSY
jgi:hypothetical protein